MASRLKLWAFGTSLIATLLFVLAGTWRDPWLWAYVCVWTSTALYAFLGIDDDLAKAWLPWRTNLIQRLPFVGRISIRCVR